MSSVGEILKNTREAKGITIEQVAEATSIRMLYLVAIENEQFNLVPGEVYLKGFIRNYANYIGLNGPAMVERYKEQVEANKKHEHSLPPQSQEVAEPQKTSIISKKKAEASRNNSCVIKSFFSRIMTKNLILALSCIVALLFLGYFISGFFFDDKGTDNNKINNAVSTQSALKKPKESTVLKDKGGVYAVKDAANIEVKVVYSAECWTEAYADGKEAFVGIMSNGKSISWSADKELVIKLGNVRAAKITCNGQEIPYEPDENGVVVRTFKR